MAQHVKSALAGLESHAVYVVQVLSRALATYVGDQEEGPGTALATVAVWGVNHRMTDPSVCVYVCEILSSK